MESPPTLPPQTLQQLVEQLHDLYDKYDDKPPIEDVRLLMESYRSDLPDWKKYAFFDEKSEHYTRNLLDHPNDKFNLIVLCWRKGEDSTPHDHTHANCFMKLLYGKLLETRYEWPEGKGPLRQTSRRIIEEDECGYMCDSYGLHKIETLDQTAVSLHLYSPPFDHCHSFDQETGKGTDVKLTYYSINGKRVYEDERDRTLQQHF